MGFCMCNPLANCGSIWWWSKSWYKDWIYCCKEIRHWNLVKLRNWSIKASYSLSLYLMLVLELIVRIELFMAEFCGILVKIRIEYKWYFRHGLFCVTWNWEIVGFLNSTLNSLRFGYKFCMFQIKSGLRKHI